MNVSVTLGRLPPARVFHAGVWWYCTGHTDTYKRVPWDDDEPEPVAEYQNDALAKLWFDYDGNQAMTYNYDADDGGMVPFTPEFG